MTTDVVDLASEGVSFLLSLNDKDEAIGSEVITSLEKLIKETNDFVELRTAVFNKNEEKIQQHKHGRLMKLKSEEEYYVNKRLDLDNNIKECVSQLKEIEYSFFDFKKKLSSEEEVNKKLKDELSSLNSEKNVAREKFLKTLSLYSEVIKRYEDYLNIHISISEDKPNIIKFYFSNCERKNYSTIPYVKFDVSDDFKFKLLETDFDFQEEKENFQELYNSEEVMHFIYNMKETLKRRSLRKVSDIQNL